MESLSYAAGSAILTRQIVEELKKRGYFTSGIMITLASFAINTLLAIAWAMFDGVPMTVAVARGIAQFIGSSLYHDLKTTGEPKAAQIVLPVSVD